MQEEMRSLLENHTYDLVKLPKGKKALKNKLVYRLKTKNNSSQLRYKARVVNAQLNLEIEQLDDKTAFLHGVLEEEIYMEQLEGFKVKDDDFIILLLYVDDMLIIDHDASKIEKLKRELSKSFAMKDLGYAKQILGMKISHDRKNEKLWLSQEAYIEKILERFNISKAKIVGSPLAGHFKLISKQCPTSEKENEEMSKVPYSSVVAI
ncbi:Retrovirus-related Pol polyprotein from transposon TNT 1-94 [Vitis vinifera]|uniref:Retrovirus-related Pol polyprotein from transposon TNT 1-94 n=1 Tax=Vitis vinifera TaxID=29760 RepID=A0A438CXQ0_VITVI|nr:Retrovirus-related Pol polyprotein from transposon TNT 1-94 [Vitis vinifera]